MRDVPILVWVSVLIVAGIGIWLATGAPLPFFGAQPAVVQPASDAQLDDTQTDAAKKVEAAKLMKKSAAKTAKTAPAAPAPEPVVVVPVAEVVIAPPVPAPAPAPAPVPRRFPAANEIPIGTERENISERFGEPSLVTTTMSDQGRVKETLVYSRERGRDVTVISIEDGKVLSAYSR